VRTRPSRLARLALILPAAFAAAAAQQPPNRALVEEFRIDGAEHEFTYILGVIPMRDGSVVVAHTGDHAATVFSPSGAVLRKLARKGAGPGEVQGFAGFGLVGDTLWMGDRNLNRITLFGADGAAARTIPISGSADWPKLRPDANGAFSSRVMPRVLMPGNAALGSPGTIASALANGSVTSIPVVRMSWDGTVSRIVAEMPVRIAALEVKSGDRTSYTSQPFRDSPLLEMSRDGRHLAFIDAREGPNPAIHIVRLNAMGDTVGKTDLPYVPVAITPRVVDSAVTAIAKMLRIADESAVRNALKVPKSYFPVDKAIPANDGTLWLRAPVANGQRRWTLVSVTGKVVETLTLPASTDIEWVDGSIWGVTRDADDVPSVVRLRKK
jgi:hypothetical protein